MKNDVPPDDWDEPDASPNPADEAALLRAAWIAAVRAHVSRMTGEPCHYNSKKSHDGGFCSETRRTYKPIWPKLADQARREGIDPVRLVSVLFASWGTGPSPLPRDLFSDKNITRYHDHVRNTEHRVKLALNTEQSIYKTALWSASQSIADPDAAVRFVLNDLGRKMTPLFRYAIATMKGLTDVADKWRGLATNQVSQAPEGYLTEWSCIIPQDIAAAARAAAGKVA